MTGTTPEQATSRQVRVGDLTFDLWTAGPDDGRPVLLLHGFPQTSWSWRHVLPGLLAAGRRVVAFDQRGYSPGACPDGVEAYAAEHLAADVLGVLDALGLEQVDLVGHDWGAAVAWQVASRHPGRITTLTALSVPHPGAFSEALHEDDDQRRRSAYMLEFAEPGYEEHLLADDAARLRRLFDGGDGVDVDHVLERLGTPERLRPPLSWYAAQYAVRSTPVPPTPVPTLHLWCDGDLALGEYGARATERHVTGPYELVVLPGVSHWIPEQAPDAVVEHHLRLTGG